MKTIRVCIYPKDVQRITGKTYTQARLYLKKNKKNLNKEEHQLLSIEEFCLYTGLPYDEVLCSILDLKKLKKSRENDCFIIMTIHVIYIRKNNPN